ncbi:MAG TPA: prolyl oligopeptidase family serine peptidase [Candidatus Sulfopaludibacter sp.]|nr:prolyl oligopeptidase family serine peptidase [Candidatus Sulfopaludibacter sp.]
MKVRLLAVSLFACAAYGQAQKPIQLPDILAWKRIQAPVVSSNGEWFAYRVVPAEGNAEVVVRNLKTGKEEHYPAGDRTASTPAPAGGGAPGRGGAAAGGAAAGGPEFSEDAKWLVFTTYPLTRDAKRMRTQRRTIHPKAVLVELATGKKTEFEKVRRFAFSGEKSTMLALQRFGADTPPAAAAANAGATPPERPTGSDVLLYDLTTGNETNLGNVSEFSFNKKGDHLAWIIDAQDKAGNGVTVLNLENGQMRPLDSAAASYKSISWTEKGDAFTALRGVDDKGFEEKLYSVVAFKNLNAATPTKAIFDPKEDKTFPAGMTVASTRPAVWRQDLSAVIFGLAEVKPKKPGARDTAPTDGDTAAAPPRPDAPEDKPSLVLWHYKDPRLQSQQQVQENADKNFSFLAAYFPEQKKFVRLADESMRQVNIAPEQTFAMGIDIRAYELEGSLDGQRFQDVYVVNPATGERKLALRKAQHVMGESPDGTKFLYYQDGVFFAYDMAKDKSSQLTRDLPATFWDNEDDHNQVRPPRQSYGWTKDSSAVLLSDGWDIWKVSLNGGKSENLTVNGKKEQLRYKRPFRLDADEKGIDLSAPVYVPAYGEWTKKNGIGLLEPGKPGIRMLLWDDAGFTQLVKAKKADTYLYTRETTKEFPNYYVTDASLAHGQKVTDANPQQKDFLWSSGVRLVDYNSTRGEKLQGALWLPANYEAGKKYPMLVYIYEKLSQAAYDYPQPTYNGFNIAHYTSNGYAVLEPDIVYKVNDPGISAVACVVPAVKAAIATGVVDAQKVGIQGHSWGGYQTAFLVTQTDVFHAAVAGAPLTDMVSMYSLIYKNTGGSNGAIFENSQGRFKGGFWDNMESYIRNSPVYHATNVHTPLMILHNDKDGAVDQTQGIEYFNTLRRMGKPVILLEYKGENHGLAKPENMKDYTVRMREFFDHYLMDKPAPAWMEEGIPLLKMKDHLDEVTKKITPAAEPK